MGTGIQGRFQKEKISLSYTAFHGNIADFFFGMVTDRLIWGSPTSGDFRCQSRISHDQMSRLDSLDCFKPVRECLGIPILEVEVDAYPENQPFETYSDDGFNQVSE